MAYFPNGSAGEVFDRQCAECPLGEGPCPIAAVQLLYNYDQLGDGQENLRDAMTILVDDKGICQTRKQMICEYRRPIKDSIQYRLRALAVEMQDVAYALQDVITLEG